MAKEQKQVCDMRAGKRMSVALSNEQLRVGDRSAWNARVAGTLDTTRSHLNFEIKKGGVITELDQKNSLSKRIAKIFEEKGISDPNIGLTDEQLEKKGVGCRTFASFILNGSTETMRRLAFGDQEVDFNRGADNSHITRNRAFEVWALDMYKFMTEKYGEENVVSFIAHLDESNPHIHCTVLPITERNKLSFKEVFVGKDKYEYSQRAKNLHDELAEINKKYGLNRGDSVLETNAQHKSYLQWLRDVIKVTKETLQSQNEEIETNTKTIDSQKQEIYTINSEIRKAEKKLKGLTTMVENLETQKAEIEKQLEAFRDEYDQGEAATGYMMERYQELQQQLQDIEAKIADKRNKLEEARATILDLAEKKKTAQHSLDAIEREINKKTPELMEKNLHDMESSLWRRMISDDGLRKDYDAISDFARLLPPEQRFRLENILENTTFADVAERGSEISAVATSLFMGYIDQALTFTQGQVSGGNNELPRKKDEDDNMYRGRCAIMGMQLIRSGGRKRGR